MGNKNHLMRTLQPLVEKTTLKVYAGMCVAISEYCEGLQPDDILQICELSEAIWQQVADKNVDIFKWCKDVSGVDLTQFIKDGRR